MIPSLDVLDAVFDDLVEKGDYEGHPFRGNQWTDSSGISRGGAGSSADQDRQAYEMRQAGQTWDAIAQSLGYANGGAVRRLAVRHEERLRADGVIPPVPPPVAEPVPEPVAEPTVARGGFVNGLLAPTADPAVAAREGRPLAGWAQPPAQIKALIDKRDALIDERSKMIPEAKRIRDEYLKGLTPEQAAEYENQSLARSRDGRTLLDFASKNNPDFAARLKTTEIPEELGYYKLQKPLLDAALIAAGFRYRTEEEMVQLESDIKGRYTHEYGSPEYLAREARVMADPSRLEFTTFDRGRTVEGRTGRLEEKSMRLRVYEPTIGRGEEKISDQLLGRLTFGPLLARGMTIQQIGEQYLAATSVANDWLETPAIRASFNNQTVAEMNAEIAKALPKLEEAVRDAQVSITVPPRILSSILKDGKFETQFVSGKSGGYNSPQARQAEEASRFGYPADLNPELRPVYGMVEETEIRTPNDRGNLQYGSALVILKPEVRERTTFSRGDSLSLHAPSTPLTNPRAQPLAISRNLDDGAKFELNYPEAQIHGGVRVSDIARVVFQVDSIGAGGSDIPPEPKLVKPPSPSLLKALDKAGIPYQIVRFTSEIDQNVSKQRGVWQSASDMLKGDYVGHPFRGNQWSDASGISRNIASNIPAGTPTQQLLTGVREYRIHLDEGDKDRWVPTLFIDGQPTTIQGTIAHYTKEKAEKGLKRFQSETEAMLGAAVKVADTDGGQRPLAELTFTRSDGRLAMKRVGWAEQGRAEALEAYTRESVALNTALRDGTSTDGPLDPFMESGGQEILYRSIANTNGVAGRLFSELTNGATIVDRGYSSTSRIKRSAAEMDVMGDGLILQIQMPSGASRLAVPKGVFFGGDQEEVILPRGSGFRLVRQGESVDGRPTLVVELVEAPESVEKGDFVGHPFRGNQWTDASGITRGGAGSTPDEDKRAYELRQQGKSWEDIAKELGYANGGSVRRLAMRHEARLKDGDKDLKVIPPVTPDVPKPSVAEAGGAVSSLADPTSVRAARRIMTQLFPDGVHTRLAELYGLKGSGNTLSREELKFLADFERAGELINNAIKAEVLFASSGESKEATILRRQALDEIEKVVRRLGADHERFGADAQNAASKNLSGLIVNTQGTLMKIYEPSLLTLVTQVEEEFAISGSDETTRAHEYILLTGDVNTPVDLSSDDAAIEEVNREMSQAGQRAQRILRNIEVKTKGRGYESAIWLFNKLDRDAGITIDEPKKTLLQADTVTVVREASSIVQGLLREITRGESTLEVVSKMSFDQIIKRGDRDGSSFDKDGNQIPFRENVIRGTTQLIDDDGEPIGPETAVTDKDFGLLGVQGRSNLVVKLVRESFQDKEVVKSLTYQAENVLRNPISVSSSLLKDPNQNATIPRGGSIHEVRALVKSLSVEVSSTDQQIIETQAAVKVLKGMGVKFTKPSDVPFQTVAAGRSSRVSPDVETDYREAVTDALQYLPQGLTDGSGSQEIVGRFAGGGKLDVTAAAGTGVRRAHATNRGSGKVLVTNPRPKRNRAGSILRGDRSVLLHEIGHGVEYANPWVRYMENLTWRDRAGNEKLKGLASLTGNKSYTSDEKAIKDEWRNSYAGKSYGGERPSAAEAYEIFTTGLQSIFYGDQVIDDKHKNVVLGILAASAST